MEGTEDSGAFSRAKGQHKVGNGEHPHCKRIAPLNAKKRQSPEENFVVSESRQESKAVDPAQIVTNLRHNRSEYNRHIGCLLEKVDEKEARKISADSVDMIETLLNIVNKDQEPGPQSQPK